MKFTSLVKSLVLLGTLLSFVSCGSKSGGMLKNVDVETELYDGEVFVSIDAELGIGNLIMPNVVIPIHQPDTGLEVGAVSMITAANGKNELGIDLNLSALTDYRANQATLPNGNILPLIGDNVAIVVPISSSADLYLSMVDGSVVVGVAVGISSFDKIGSKLGTTSLFPIFNQGGRVSAGGVYTSNQAGLNGFGFFTDISGNLETDMLDALVSIQMEQDGASLKAKSIEPRSSRTHSKLNYELYKLHRKRTKLKLSK